MLSPTDCMRSFLSGSWLENELTGSIRQLAGTDTTSSQGGASKVGGASQAEGAVPEEENKSDITPAEAFNAVTVEGEALLSDMHAAAMVYPNLFDRFLNNMDLNRIPHLYCYDHTRVVVSTKHGSGDYYHASFVDGYNKKSAYIFAQAPFDDDSERVFWRLVVDQKPSMILVFGGIDVGQSQRRKQAYNIADKGFEKAFKDEFEAVSLEQCETKAKLNRSFWPEKGGVKDFDKISIKTTDEHTETHMKTFNLQVKEGGPGDGRPTVLMHFDEWGMKDDDELPEYMLDMRASIKVQYIRSSKKAGAFTGPILLVCATGVSKCAIYATIDIIVSRMTEEHTVGFKETMSAIKTQRFGCFRSPKPYTTARQMLMKFAVSTGVVHDTAIGDKPKTMRKTVQKSVKMTGFKRSARK